MAEAKPVTTADRLEKAGKEFKRLEARIEKLELKSVSNDLRSVDATAKVIHRYEMIAEVCKGLLSIVNKEISELTNKEIKG